MRLCAWNGGVAACFHGDLQRFGVTEFRSTSYWGNMIDATKRHSYGDWDHAVQDAAATVYATS